MTECGQIGSHAAAFPEPELYRLQPGELVLAASEGDIPSIQTEDSYFVQVEKADLEDTDLVVGLLIGVSRAYPVRLLSLHEVVNDRVGDRAIAVTWCPLCYSAVVFDRVVDGEELSFRASGYLLHDNLVLIDHPTDTLWSQLLGQGIKGARRGSIWSRPLSQPRGFGVRFIWIPGFCQLRIWDMMEISQIHMQDTLVAEPQD